MHSHAWSKRGYLFRKLVAALLLQLIYPFSKNELRGNEEDSIRVSLRRAVWTNGESLALCRISSEYALRMPEKTLDR